MKKYYLNKTALKILKVMSFFVALLLTVLARIYLSVYPIVMWSAIALFWFLFFSLGLIALPIYFSSTYYCVSSNEISKQSGVFIKSQQLLRVSSIQYITKIYTPFSHFTGLNFIKMNAFGGFMVLMFLSKSDAQEISSTVSFSIRNNGT